VFTHVNNAADIDTLPKPSFSSNLIFENRRYVKQAVTPTIQQDSNSNGIDDVGGTGTGHHQSPQQPPSLTLKRGKNGARYIAGRSSYFLTV
jgi:hypothetical protein